MSVPVTVHPAHYNQDTAMTIDQKSQTNFTSQVVAARVGHSPTSWRLARRNGELILQAGSHWVQGMEYGVEWNDVPTVDLDELEANP
jgi:hypothetical protein